jgi:hypothetical protein
MNTKFKNIYEATHKKDIDGLVLAIKNAKGVDIGIYGLEEVGPDQPLIHQGPVFIWINADKEIVVHNQSISFHIRINDIIVSEKGSSDTYWSILLKNGQEFGLDLRKD